MNVIVTVTNWLMCGVHNFIANLVPGLIDRGLNARVLCTSWVGWIDHEKNLPVNFPLEIAPWRGETSWRIRWKAMTSYLEDLAPCVYLPGDDWAYSCVTPKLSNRVVVIGHMHADNGEYFDHFARLGRYFNQTVAGSEYLRSRLAAQYPDLAHRLSVLPYGVRIPARRPVRTWQPGAPLRLLYSGRLSQEAKRVLDLPRIAESLIRRQIPVRLSFTGWGQDEAALRAACHRLSDQGLVQFHGMVSEDRLAEIYEENDVIILTSEYEGKPLSLIEGMGRACIPVVTDVPSGVPELVKDGINGYLVPVGAIEVFTEKLAALWQDLQLRERFSANAYQTVSQGGYRIDDMVRQYSDLFRRLLDEAMDGRFHRPRGLMPLPPRLAGRPDWDQPTWKDLLPEPIRAVGKRFKGALRRAAGGSFPAVGGDKPGHSRSLR